MVGDKLIWCFAGRETAEKDKPVFIRATLYITEFIVEKALNDCVEIGMDAYTINGQFPDKMMCGIELKDAAYLGEMRNYKDIPKEITEFNDKISSALKDYGFCGNISTEMRVGKDKISYMNDLCCRLPSPPAELYQEFYLNWAEIMWYGSKGIMIQPKSIAKYGMQLILKSSWAEKNFQPISFDKKYRKNIKLKNACIIDGEYYIIPQEVGLKERGAVIGWGNTIDECKKMIHEVGDTISGYDIKIPYSVMDEAENEIKKSEKMGIKIFS